MKTPYLSILLIAVFLMSFPYLNAQDNVFNIGIVAGANISQIGSVDPGPSLDTNSERFLQRLHHGLNAGIVATIRVSEYSQIGVEFLFSQNGKYVRTDPIFEKQETDIFINYLEIPIHYNWQSPLTRNSDFNNFSFEAGIAYAKLLTNSSKFIRGKLAQNPDFFDRTETILLQSAMTFYLTRKWGLNFKLSVPADTKWTGITFAARTIILLR